MFDWFWEFLYSISEILFEIIDGLMSIANMLCGIEPITIDSTKTDFLSYLLNNDKIMYGFIGAGLVGIFLVMVFSIFAMIKSIKGKSNLTPFKVAINVFKTLAIFLFVPFVMIAFSAIVNELMIVLYKATSMGSESMGDFLFKAFLPDGMDPDGFVNFRDVDSVDAFMELSGYDLDDYKFFFSWICCIPLLFALAKGLLNFVDRSISIVLLFIASPLSISTSIIDDGAHFKLWRDQVLVKFLTGYGIILGLNVYILIVSIISNSSVVFFENSFLNFLFKIAFMLGGAFSLERVMALVGNLVSAGAGSNELRDGAIAYNGMKGFAKGLGRFAKGVAKAPVDMINGANDIQHKGLGQTMAESVGLRTERDYKNMGYVNGNEKPVQEQILDAIIGLKDGNDNSKKEQNKEQSDGGGSLQVGGQQNSKKSENKEEKNKNLLAMIGGDSKLDNK